MKHRIFTALMAVAAAAAMRAQQLPDLYIYNNVEQGRGAIIANAEGEVIGYTDRGTADDAAQTLKVICDRKAVKADDGLGARRALSALRASRRMAQGKAVGPLLRNLWSQYEAPYDWLSPKIDGEPCDAGCVALAMAQVMHYWQWPEHGYGSYAYTDEKGCGLTFDENFENHYYDWANMLGNYEGVQYTEAQGYAVAQLLYDCAVAVDMHWGVDGSGAEVVRQPLAMVRNFGYDSSCQMHYRDFYTLDEWTQMFYDELDAGRPILMSGLSNKYNHAFVCDGYDERGFFHFSLGNPNGAADGFFYLPYLTPDIRPDMVPEEAEGGFNILQSMTTRIMPACNPEATGVQSHLFALSGMDAIGGDTCVVRNLANVGWNMLGDSVALALVRNDEVVALPYVYEHEFLLEEIEDTAYTDTIALRTLGDGVLANVPEGTCKLMPMYRDNGVWTAARTTVGTPNYLIANIKSGGIELHRDTDASGYLTLESYSFPEWLPAKFHAPDYSLRITCHNADLCGRVYVMLENVVDSLPSYAMQTQGLTLSAGETVDLRYYHTYKALQQGTYNLCIYYDHDLFTPGKILLNEDAPQTVVVSESRPDAIGEVAAERAPAAEGAYSISGMRMPDGEQPRGIIVKGGKKYYYPNH